MRSMLAIATIAFAATLAGNVSAQNIAVRAGIANVNPASDNGIVAGADASIDSNTRFALGASYFLDDQWELSLDAGATTFKHTVTLAGLGEVVSLKHLPISLGANWHFLGSDNGGFSPYVGLGYNWTSLSDVRGINALDGAPVDVADSDGLTAALGADYLLGEQWFIRGEARYIDFDSEVTLGGANIGTATVDPWVWSLQLGLKF